MDIDAIYEPVQTDLVRVRESLLAIVPPETALLVESVHHAMGGEGKLFRPLLCLLASGASGQIESSHIETAAVAELIHVATLLHDDVLDDAGLRRGKATIRALWGNKISILSGDYLLAQASLKLSKLNNCRLVSIFATVLSNLCEGEVEQIHTSYNLKTSWDSYFKKSICKTASLFSACCESAGVLNHLPETEIQALKLFGEQFGIAFQIVDDLLDYTASAEKLGKPVLDDLKNGLLNAPVLIALEAFEAQPEKRQTLETLVEKVFTEDPESLQQALFALLEEADAIPKTLAMAEDYAEKARSAIRFLPPTPYLKALEGLTRYAIRREY